MSQITVEASDEEFLAVLKEDDEELKCLLLVAYVQQKKLDRVAALLKGGVQLNFKFEGKYKEFKTPKLLAAKLSDSDIEKVWKENCSPKDYADFLMAKHCVALDEAIWYVNVQEVRRLLPGADLDYDVGGGYTPRISAADIDDPEINAVFEELLPADSYHLYILAIEFLKRLDAEQASQAEARVEDNAAKQMERGFVANSGKAEPHPAQKSAPAPPQPKKPTGDFWSAPSKAVAKAQPVGAKTLGPPKKALPANPPKRVGSAGNPPETRAAAGVTRKF